MADQIVSWGGFNSKGTSGMGVTGSFQVSSSANSFFVGGGNVGIGTTSPSASFTVNNTDVIFGSNAGYGTYYGAANDGTFQVKPNGNQTEVWLRPAGNSLNLGNAYWSSLQTSAASLKVLSGQYGDLYFGAGVNTLLTIYNPTSGAGHVGIGTTTPHYKLQVVGTAYSGSFNANDQVVINTAGNMGVGTTAPTARLQVKGSGTTSSTTAFLVQNTNASSSLVVLDNNYVGIGKSPSYPLDVAVTNGGNANSGMFVTGVHPDGRVALYGKANTNTEQLLYWWHSGGIAVGTGGSARGGAVSYVGDTSFYGPSHTMYFMETGATFGPTNIKYRLGITTSTTNTSFATGVSNNLTNIESNTFTFTAKSHTFYTGTTTGSQSLPNQFTPLHLSTSGSVGIGTLTPSASLHVSGAFLGYPVTVPTASGTASLDCNLGNFFNLTLSSSYTLFLSASNVQPGQTINLRVTQPATSGSLNYGSQFKFAGGIPYSASATGSAVDIISFITFDTTNLYGSAIKNLS